VDTKASVCVVMIVLLHHWSEHPRVPSNWVAHQPILKALRLQVPYVWLSDLMNRLYWLRMTKHWSLVERSTFFNWYKLLLKFEKDRSSTSREGELPTTFFFFFFFFWEIEYKQKIWKQELKVVNGVVIS